MHRTKLSNSANRFSTSGFSSFSLSRAPFTLVCHYNTKNFRVHDMLARNHAILSACTRALSVSSSFSSYALIS